MATKNDPGDYDCYANALPDEPMFILLGRDRMAPSLVKLWWLARAPIEHPDKVENARQVEDQMRNWLYTSRKEALDVLDLVPVEVLTAALQRRAAANATPSDEQRHNWGG